MGRQVRMTEARIKRVMAAARAVDPAAIVEVTAEGTIRILPAVRQLPTSEVDRWFDGED